MAQIVKCIAGVGIKEERNKTVTTLHNMFSKHVFEVLADLLTEKLQAQSYARSYQSDFIHES